MVTKVKGERYSNSGKVINLLTYMPLLWHVISNNKVHWHAASFLPPFLGIKEF